MSRKVLVLLISIILIAAGVFLYLKYRILKAPDHNPDVSKKETVLDLRPQLIAKLQQLVKDGSAGLYKLSLEQVSPDLAASTVDIQHGTIDIDSSMLTSLDNAGKLPDDIFKVSFSKIHISGLGIADFISKKNLNLGNIKLDNPIIEVYHQPRTYNIASKKAKENLTLYQNISGIFHSLSIEKILISKGRLIHHNLAKKEVLTKMEDVSIMLDDLLIDSSTQYDKSRYLFAKKAKLNAKNYHVITPDNYYSFKIGSIEVLGEQRHVSISNLVFEPYGGRAAFRKKLKERKVIFDINIPHLEMDKVDWWSFLNRQEWFVSEGFIEDATFGVFVDLSLPAPVLKQNNFPHQLVMRLPFPLKINKLNIKRSKVIYEEYNPKVDKTAMVTINKLNGTLNNICNIRKDISSNPLIRVNANGLFMNKVPIDIGVNLNLARVSTGDFTADITVDTLNKELINPVSEISSLFTVKRGQMQKGKAHISGNNSMAKGNISLYYDDLHITPLKPVKTEDGDQKSKHLTSFVANTLFIKNANPKNGTLRQPEFLIHRDAYTGFVKLIWVAIRAGIVKSVGIPLKAIDKNAE
ncbi:MAG: hypothetical protein ABIW38_04960 [Ferruginibacter sp.]